MALPAPNSLAYCSSNQYCFKCECLGRRTCLKNWLPWWLQILHQKSWYCSSFSCFSPKDGMQLEKLLQPVLGLGLSWICRHLWIVEILVQYLLWSQLIVNKCLPKMLMAWAGVPWAGVCPRLMKSGGKQWNVKSYRDSPGIIRSFLVGFSFHPACLSAESENPRYHLYSPGAEGGRYKR